VHGEGPARRPWVAPAQRPMERGRVRWGRWARRRPLRPGGRTPGPLAARGGPAQRGLDDDWCSAPTFSAPRFTGARWPCGRSCLNRRGGTPCAAHGAPPPRLAPPPGWPGEATPGGAGVAETVPVCGARDSISTLSGVPRFAAEPEHPHASAPDGPSPRRPRPESLVSPDQNTARQRTTRSRTPRESAPPQAAPRRPRPWKPRPRRSAWRQPPPPTAGAVNLRGLTVHRPRSRSPAGPARFPLRRGKRA
jgi:hypothetical protein